MAEKTDILKPEHERDSTANQLTHRKEAREALQRLRRIGESLPAVDAAAVVRAGREASEQDAR